MGGVGVSGVSHRCCRLRYSRECLKGDLLAAVVHGATEADEELVERDASRAVSVELEKESGGLGPLPTQVLEHCSREGLGELVD